MANRLLTTPEILSAAAAYCYYYRLTLLKLLAIPVVLLVFFEAIRQYAWIAEQFWVTLTLIALAIALLVSVTSLVSVTVHRVVLLGEASYAPWGIAWTRRETRYVAHLLALILLVAPLFLLALVPGLGYYLSLLAVGYVGSRLSLVFPAIALDRVVSFRTSWKLTRRYGALIFLVAAFLPWLLARIPALMDGVIYALPLKVVLDTLVTVFAVAAVSLVYRRVAPENDEAPDLR